MSSRAKDYGRLGPWLMGAAASLFYLNFHSYYYNFDGVACAIAVELADWAHLVHGNHLAYGVVGWLFDRLWRLMGYGGSAILPLQCLDSLLGGVGVGLFCRLLRKLKFSPAISIGAATGLAVSQSYWFWSLEAQVYLLGVVFVILTATEALSEKPRPIFLGALHACAILGHVGHLMFLPVIAYRLWKSKAGLSAWIRYFASLGAAVAAAYAAAAVFCVRPNDAPGLHRWLLGSAALTVDRGFTWQGGYSIHGFAEWVITSCKLMVDRRGAMDIGLLLAGIPLIAAAAGAFRKGARGQIAAACLIWIASYFILFSTWEPFLDVYRISDLVALWLLVSLALEKVPASAAAFSLALWTAGAGIFNATQSIGPRADSTRNATYQEALWLAKTTPENSWIIVTGPEQVYVPYFAHRKPLNLRYFGGGAVLLSEQLYRRLDALMEAGEPVFIGDKTLGFSGWQLALRNYGLGLEREEGGRKLYRVRRKESPAGPSRKN